MDELLEKLIQEAQDETQNTERRNIAITLLVEQILRSRKIGCLPRGQPLVGVHQEIYEKLQQQLFHDLNQQIDNYNRETIPPRQWTATLRNYACKQILDDAQLKKLALATQQYPPNSKLRQHTLTELVEAIRLSRRLCRPHQHIFSPPNFYELLYEEAVNETLLYVCSNIDLYDPERGKKKFMNWVNFRLDRSVLECRRKFSDVNVQSFPSIHDLEKLVALDKPPSLFEMVREYIEKDPDKILQKAHIRNRKDANFQTMALARISGKGWSEISAELKIPVGTITSFFGRYCRKFAPNFKNYLPNQ